MPRTNMLAATGYGTLAIADTLLATSGSPTAKQLRRLTKPLLMPALAASFAGSTSGSKSRLRRGVLAAHGFSWAGDVALLGGSERALLTGVGSFFAAHVAYLTAFTSVRRRPADFNTIGLKTAALAWAASAPAVTIAAGARSPASASRSRPTPASWPRCTPHPRCSTSRSHDAPGGSS